ncbi:hypothetical protein B0H67DRAFT_234262 [Lasiosphaeris hirsuta]|uniref:Uncharacterized protein n=1 Tax=Lasiosphaeris hirsuta TaxID=260670 RepID=A0AA40DVV6_9PEZI|nr:hypothetical protein B0H67DRAFT_234262 [Lasiosphaeris hirsuta]
MAKQRPLLLWLFLSPLSLSAVALSEGLPAPTAVGHPHGNNNTAQNSAQRQPEFVAKVQSSTKNEQAPSLIPKPTASIRIVEVTSLLSAPCPTTTPFPSELHRRQNINNVITIRFLNSALASAVASASSVSRELALSITQLQSSMELLSSSASDALLEAQASASNSMLEVKASASDAVVTAEQSASGAIAAAEQSASSKVGEVLALASSVSASAAAITPVVTTVEVQPPTEAGNATLSVTRAIIAIVVSVAGSSLLSLLGCYLFVRRHKKKQKLKEEELDVNLALDRAIVSYIAKESPTPTTRPHQIGRAVMLGDNINKEARQRRLKPSLVLSPLRQASLRSPKTPKAPPPPAGPPPTCPLPDIPCTTAAPKTPPRRPSVVRPSPDSAERVYSDILARPIQPITSPRSPERSPEPAVHTRPPEWRNSNWPLPKAVSPWL